MKQRDPDELPSYYRDAYLIAIDENVPEVMHDLVVLVPKYNEVFGNARSPFTEALAEPVQKFDGESRRTLYPFVGGFIEKLCTLPDESRPIHDRDGNVESSTVLGYLTGNQKFQNLNAQLTNDEKQLLKDFIDLRNSFQEFIDRYWLNTDWLRQHLFWLLKDIARYPEAKHSLWEGFAFAYMSRNVERLTFEYDAWQIDEDSEDYKKRALKAFQSELTKYVAENITQRKADGFIRFKDNRRAENIKWLIHWNLKQYRNLWEIIPDLSECEDFQNFDMKDERRVKSAVDKIRKAFEVCENSGLPVREWMKKRKSKRKYL
ncbi:MAG: hypothetical protein WKF92_05650 [Pyrinomonadaceae bacterium]